MMYRRYYTLPKIGPICFNGKNLDGGNKQGSAEYKVDGNELSVIQNGEPKSTYLCTKKDPMGILSSIVDGKWTVGLNSGIQFRSRLMTMVGKVYGYSKQK